MLPCNGDLGQVRWLLDALSIPASYQPQAKRRAVSGRRSRWKHGRLGSSRHLPLESKAQPKVPGPWKHFFLIFLRATSNTLPYLTSSLTSAARNLARRRHRASSRHHLACETAGCSRSFHRLYSCLLPSGNRLLTQLADWASAQPNGVASRVPFKPHLSCLPPFFPLLPCRALSAGIYQDGSPSGSDATVRRQRAAQCQPHHDAAQPPQVQPGQRRPVIGSSTAAHEPWLAGQRACTCSAAAPDPAGHPRLPSAHVGPEDPAAGTGHG